ncbi:hypothetical protein D3C87_308850 [compost metagenome]
MRPITQKVLSALTVLFLAVNQNHSFSQANSLPASGNVGIGVTNPSSKLQVNGSARIDSSLTVRDSMTVDRDAHIRSNLQVDGKTTLNDDLILSSLIDSTFAEDGVLLVDSTGKVKNAKSLKSLVYAQAEQIHCLSDMNGGTVYSAPYWQAQGMPNPIMYLVNTQCSPDPRLGVGVKPTAKVHVQLNVGSQLHPLVIERRMSNNPNANIDPYKLLQLDHNGLLYAREVKVNLDNWSDYVFDEKYPLMPLNELQQFIRKNNHLPNVPSAAEMTESGLNLAKTSILFMEKIEELTLYVLQINEQVKTRDLLLNEQQELLKQQQETIRLQQELIQKLEEKVKP